LLGYGVYRDSLTDVSDRVENNLLVKMTGRNMELVQNALELATSNKESGNISKLSKQLKGLGQDYKGEIGSAVNTLVEAWKVAGLLVLRFILMVSNCLLAGKLFRVIGRELTII
jgi:hypothetical protein